MAALEPAAGEERTSAEEVGELIDVATRFLDGFVRGGVTAAATSGTPAGAAAAAQESVPVDPVAPNRALRELSNLFHAAREKGLDPRNDGSTGPAWTTENSAWLGLVCEGGPTECGHTFRVDDRVFVEYEEGTGRLRRVRHDTPALPCSERVDSEILPPREVSERFFAGIARTNPPEMSTTRLRPGHPLVAARRDRQRCKFCGDTFRPLEEVIMCPCRPADPMCQTALHRDPRQGLLCYDEWTKDVDLAKCLMDPRKPLNSPPPSRYDVVTGSSESTANPIKPDAMPPRRTGDDR